MDGKTYKKARHKILINKKMTEQEKVAALVELNKRQRKESHEAHNG